MPAEVTRPAHAARPLRAGDLLGRTAVDADGRVLGRVVDLVTEPDADGRPRVTAALVVRGRWGRLLGYERDQVTNPWVLEALARWVLRRDQTEVPWLELVLEPRDGDDADRHTVR